MTQVMHMPVKPGELAPDFSVPAVQHDGTISLADYRGRSPLLLGLFRGLYCPFCRRAVALMAATSEKLKPLGVESLAIVGTELDNARLYFKFRPTRLTLGADPHLTTHRSYGVPQPDPTREMRQRCLTPTSIRAESSPAPLPIGPRPSSARSTDTSLRRPIGDHASTFTLMNGQFIIDRDGIVRWTHIECGMRGSPASENFLFARRIDSGRELRHRSLRG